MKLPASKKSCTLPAIAIVLLFSCGSPKETPLWGENGEISVRLRTIQGEIEIRLLTDSAPRHSENFARLCESGFYDDTYFHRVAPGVLIQGGDPNTKDDDPANDGKGGHSFLGPETMLEAEISDLQHRRGSVSMARGSDPNSAGSQFFIMLKKDTELDGQYLVFGEVIKGMEVVEIIAEQPGQEYPEIGGVNPYRKQIIEECRTVLPETVNDSESNDSSESTP